MSSAPACPLPPNRSLPARLRAGDGYAWSVQTDTTRISPGSFVFYVLTGVVNNVPVRYTIDQPTSSGTPAVYAGSVTTDSNGIAAFTVTGAVTAAWQPGRYQWILFAMDAQGNRDQIAEGALGIDPNPLGTTPTDPRSRNEKLLGAIRCLLDGKALDDAQMYKIGGRELTKIPVKDLLYWEGVVEARVRREYIRRGQFVPTNTVGITFGGR